MILQLTHQLEQRLPPALFRLEVAADLDAGSRWFARSFGLNLVLSEAGEV